MVDFLRFESFAHAPGAVLSAMKNEAGRGEHITVKRRKKFLEKKIAQADTVIFDKTGIFDVDIACACDLETLFKIFPNAEACSEEGAMAILEENGVTLRFYPTDVEDASPP